VHCAGCIQKIESTLNQFDRVNTCRLNFTTGALVITWRGETDKANRFVQSIVDLGYGVSPYQSDNDDHDTQNRFLLMCMGVAGFAAGNIMLLSFGLWITNQDTMGYATREFLHLISALIAVPAVLFAGRPFFQSAWGALKNKRTNMDVPISLALILATGMSIHELWRGAEHVYFDSALMLCFFLLIGRYLDFQARASARSAATDLMSTLSGFATVVEGQRTRKIPIRDVKPDMIVQVVMGEKIPVDGIVVKGETDIDTSLVTGETIPRPAKKGMDVFAGTLNLSNTITIRVARASGESLLADIVRLMEKAEQGQAHYTRLADRAAKLYTPMVHTLAIVAFILWFFIMGAPWQDSLMIAVTVLIITCPCALGLAVPVAQVLSTGQLLKHRIMVKSGDALERLAKITSVFFDKTGTLTHGRPKLIGDYNSDDLQLAASLASHSRHPLSQSIVNAWDGDLLSITHVKEIAGQGLKGKYKGKDILLGNHKLLDVDKPDHDGLSLYLSIKGQSLLLLKFEDSLRDDAKETLEILKSRGLSLSLLSGDRAEVVQSVAQYLPFDQTYGDLKPTEKYKILEDAKSNQNHILMVGDGLNDAPVLAGADVSMAPGTAIDMAQNAADIVFMGNDLNPVAIAHGMAIKTQDIIKQNFAIAVLYNMIAIPIAFMGFVTPMIAAIAMSGSSILVIANSFRLKLKS
jgi:Cu2+-exporting ATPase